MKKAVLYTIFTILAVFPSTASAQQRCGLNLDVQYSLMGMWNKDTHTTIIDFSRQFEPDYLAFVTSFQEVNMPVPFSLGRSFTLRGGLYYRPCGISRWGFGVRGWLYNTTAQHAGEVVSPNNLGVRRGVRIRDKIVYPGANSLSPTGLSPIFNVVSNKIYPRSLDFLASKTLLVTPRGSNVALIIGVKRLTWEDYSVNLQIQELFVNDYYVSVTEQGDTLSWHLNANYFIQDDGLLTATLFGPTIGIGGALRESARLRFSGSLVFSWLFGTGREQGVSYYAFDELYSEGDASETIPEPIGRVFLDIEESVYYSEQRIAIPSTELEAIATLALTRSVYISAGGFIAVFSDIPTAPQWSSDNLKWTTPKTSPVVAGITIGARYHRRIF